jgi:3-oxoacyl-[acyl-carrier protein] reductase
MQRSEQAIPLGRFGTTAEFGAVAAFLASPLAAYITGSLIRVDGGVLRSV